MLHVKSIVSRKKIMAFRIGHIPNTLYICLIAAMKFNDVVVVVVVDKITDFAIKCFVTIQIFDKIKFYFAFLYISLEDFP